MKRKPKQKPIQVWFPESVHARLKALKPKYTTVAAFARQAIMEKLEREERPYARQETS